MNQMLDDLLAEEERLTLSEMNSDIAFEIGSAVRAKALESFGPVAIDITINGLRVFSHAMEGATLDNLAWVERKRALVERFGHSSWYMKHLFDAKGVTMEAKYAISPKDFAAAGGGFPLRVKGAGRIGVITVSGLPQADDHRLIVEVLEGFVAR